MKKRIILTIILMTLINILLFESHCNNQKECIVLKDKFGHKETGLKMIKCLLTDKSRLRFNKSFEKISGGKKCQKVDLNGINKLLLRPKNEGTIRFEKGMIDLEDFIGFERMFNLTIFAFEIQLFKGFELNLYDDSIENNEILNYFKQRGIIYFTYSTLNFYQKDIKLTTCKEFIKAANSTNPRSIFRSLALTIAF